MIYTKPINEISYDDIIKFCEQKNRESFILDYKEILPDNEKLAKSIAAFANTYGGLLLIGVKAGDGFPQGPFVGFDHDNKISYEEKIQSVILSYIRQPLFPEIKVCGPVNGKSFIVILIAESNLTPHRIGDKVRIYVRTGELSNPIDEPTWEDAEWLRERRKKSIIFRQSLIEDVEKYFKAAFQYKYHVDPETFIGRISYKILPLFPQGPLITFANLLDCDKYILIREPTNKRFPPGKLKFEPIQNGVQLLDYVDPTKDKTKNDYMYVYSFINNLGVHAFKEKLGFTEVDGTNFFDVINMLEKLHQFLKSSLKYYKELGYWGALYLDVEFNNILGLKIKSVNMTHTGRSIIEIPTNHLRWERQFSLADLESEIKIITSELGADITWSLGLDDYGKEKIESYISYVFYKKTID